MLLPGSLRAKHMFYKSQLLVLAGLIMAAAFSVVAQEQTADDRWLLRFGAAYIEPLSDSEGVLGDNGLGLIPGNDGIDVAGELGFTFSLSYAFTPNIAATLLAAAPFEHQLNGTGALQGVELGETTHLPPSLTLEYRFNPNGRIRPFIGAGVNWTWFFDSDSDPALTSALDGIIGGVNSTDLDLSNSFGFAANAGIDWQINDRWGISTQLWFIDISSEAQVFVNDAFVTEVDVDVDPLVFMLGANYRF